MVTQEREEGSCRCAALGSILEHPSRYHLKLISYIAYPFVTDATWDSMAVWRYLPNNTYYYARSTPILEAIPFATKHLHEREAAPPEVKDLFPLTPGDDYPPFVNDVLTWWTVGRQNVIVVTGRQDNIDRHRQIADFLNAIVDDMKGIANEG